MQHKLHTQHSKSLVLNCFIMLVCSLFMLNSATAKGRFKAKGVTTNAAGGITSARASAASGQNGNGYMRTRGSTTNGQGQVSGGGSTVVKGQNGAGGRAGHYHADNQGNVNYSGAAAASGANGQAATKGGFSRDANGNIRGSRSSTATANNGSSYYGNTTYDNNGVSHTQVCYNANGQEISCPTKN